MTAHDDLREALRAALDARQTIIPCFPPAPPWWIAEDADRRAQAAARCQPCPAIAACALAAESTRERFGVWSGIDRSPKRKAKP